ncbi:MAG: class I SAM-dependent methyltransferase [Mycobacterium sp.]|nr:class I SAM-dependent methyltransferase [Mycobacterium sp.]
MNGTFSLYKSVGHRVVTGFLHTEILAVLEVLDSVQRADGVSGAVAEIGVHHGKLFIGLRLLQHSGERSVAIDVFGDQDLNIDNSGKGDKEKFLANLTLWSSDDDVVIHQGDSTKITPEALRELAGGDIRFFSVDGGHTAEIVFSDMKLAEATLCPGGVVIADDVFNQHWPGVSVGTLRYLEDGAALAPFFIGFNKVFFTQPGYCEKYRTALASAFTGKLRVDVNESVFAGHPVGVLVPQGAVDLLRRSELARSTYHRSYRGLVRTLQKVSGRSQ